MPPGEPSPWLTLCAARVLMWWHEAWLQAVAPAHGGLSSADLFGERDDDARGPTEVAQADDALVLGDLAEELGSLVHHL